MFDLGSQLEEDGEIIPGRYQGAKPVKHKWEQENDLGLNREFLTHAVELAQMKPVSMKDPEAVAERVTEYFTKCADRGLRPTTAGLALSIHMDRKNMLDIISGKRNAPAESRQVLVLAEEIINSTMEDYMVHSKIHPISGIFLMRNNHGYTNEDQPQVEPRDALGEAKDAEQLRMKYEDQPD